MTLITRSRRAGGDHALKAGRWIGWMLHTLEEYTLWKNEDSRRVVRQDAEAGNDRPLPRLWQTKTPMVFDPFTTAAELRQVHRGVKIYGVNDLMAPPTVTYYVDRLKQLDFERLMATAALAVKETE